MLMTKLQANIPGRYRGTINKGVDNRGYPLLSAPSAGPWRKTLWTATINGVRPLHHLLLLGVSLSFPKLPFNSFWSFHWAEYSSASSRPTGKDIVALNNYLRGCTYRISTTLIASTPILNPNRALIAVVLHSDPTVEREIFIPRLL